MTENRDEKGLLFRIGLARKAGALISGADMVCDAIRQGKVLAVILANDVSGNTAKRVTDTCRYYEIPMLTCQSTKEALGAAIGKPFAAAIGITDKNLTKLILSIQ